MLLHRPWSSILTPLGEPLSTIAISKLQGAPYHAGFFFPFEKLGLHIIPGVLAIGVLGIFFTRKDLVRSA